MTKADSAAAGAPGVGVGEARLLRADFVTSGEAGVACWYSEGGVAGGAAKDDLLAFHRVVHTFFQAGAVVPFRFPTTLADTAALSAWLQSNAVAVERELERLTGMVQMELHVTAEQDSAKKDSTPSGGREYLEARRDAQSALREAAAAARQRVAGLAVEWRERETRAGLRCYALVARGQEREFAARIEKIDGSGALDLGAAVRVARVRVTGPWPPAEFLDAALTTPS